MWAETKRLSLANQIKNIYMNSTVLLQLDPNKKYCLSDKLHYNTVSIVIYSLHVGPNIGC